MPRGGNGSHWVGCEESHHDCALVRLAESRAALESAQPARDDVLKEKEEADALNRKLGDILTRAVNALRGQPDERSLHSWATIPEEILAARAALASAEAERDALRAAGMALADAAEKASDRWRGSWPGMKAAIAEFRKIAGPQ